ncbi:MAG: universal stress protein [Bacteroidia bacterium]|nr:universal stress protein [Bacteroidia bacterium]NNF30832.1 universal stress protein [Flavobacteriaceae bacterium]MBT8275461.1 universal stress protein [Bacteroidia bacterium]NNJ82005.1 universal stress protein [Flavobacteriaceae bacterium]NNK54445.1 universal stress protein [Flavobacteriaceae bacterium]
MKTLLVPIDFSDHSEYALEVAAKIAKRHDSSIVALHMMGLSQAVLTKDDSQEVFEAMYYMKLAEKRFKDFLDRDYLEGIEVQTTVQNYKLFHEIDQVAQEFKADLIVMGSHGSSGLREVFVGSNTEKVVRNSEIPVLVVKNKMGDEAMNKVVFANNFDNENVSSFLKARKLFSTLDVDMQLVYINTPGDGFKSTQEMEEKVADFFVEANVNGEYSVNDVKYFSAYSIEEGIFAYSNKVNADLIAIPTHGRKGLAHFFTGSISEDLVNHSDLPVITFKM